MKNEKILTIIKGQEFKLSLKDKIEINDIFYDQYLEAAAMLENIVANEERDKQPDWKKAETENNIIAFCGERGEGKSSAMFTFINAVVNEKEQKESTIFAQCENVKNTVFSEPIVIDPSAFDNVHNVLDIIIASLYRKFSDKYDVSPERFANYRREELLNEFQKVYKDISLLNDPVKMLEEEYDYEGSIEKISKMGESLRLRRDLSNLVKLYLDYMMTEDSRNQYTSKKLLIAIDDLDMCNANAYKMAEQIRKYLIIPDIVIVMALKVEQLQLCVQEENFKNYSNVLKNQGKIAGAVIDVEDMAERYIAKLIPKSRRIYLPNVRYIENAKIVYQKNEEEIIYADKITNSLNASLLDLIKSVCQAEITPCCEIYYGFYTYCRNQSPTSSGIAKKVERMFDKVTTLTISYSEFFEIFAQTKRILVEEKLTFDKYLLEISLMSLKGYSSTDISEIMRENYLK